MAASFLADEVLAVNAIYPGCLELSAGSTNTYALKNSSADRPMIFLTFNADYPVSSPTFVVATDVVSRDRVAALITAARGTEVICGLIELLEETSDHASLPSDEPSSLDEYTANSVVWHIGDPVQDRKSVMLGRSCTVKSMDDVYAALNVIRGDKKLQKASHPCIYAYRYLDDNCRVVHDCDDDGETGAGANLAFLLDVTNCKNVLLVVTRWFGGILLGDVRFKHIVTAGRDALKVGKFLLQ